MLKVRGEGRGVGLVKLSKVELYLYRVAHSPPRLVSIGTLYLKKLITS